MAKELKSVAKTTETSLRLIDVLRDTDGMTIVDLSEHLGLAPSTVHRHLATLKKHGYVVRDGDVYALGLQFLTIGGQIQRRVTAYPMIKEKVDALADETGERAQFIVEENGERVYLYTEVGQSAVQTGAHVGKRGAIHTSAGGKAILAAYDRDRVEAILDDRGLDAGHDAITTREELFAELDAISDRGYAFNRQETTAGVHAIGAPVIAGGEVVGALSVSGPANRITGDRFTEALPERILGAVNELELHIEHSV
ncbi:transcriptional regulator [Halorubrum sp. Ib24]|uniref:IclR family transcriptional regulator n=1 Tax=unclassified Halorubrum TaxID=2642239 RepID=UPI000B9966EF|nr:MULTISPECIES: IclR family transcriptional regulator [unclassified Halorubrum]OYR40061.1 transcriptional regulator [Halorubrum sp. Ib24]OYR47606.1 transcriptional regulator [Halorubrum sp. Hd13]OYR49271.1 transcriptional regulator [Halorubrum sp. Eb13]OYR51696.1 transcriptional regulator [Halorubrum sp. Ea8]OYR51879.1 transcriptional regulator [Halorubrum sp. Ea1]